MDLKTLDWDPQLCKMFGVPIECLPEITSSTRDFGVLRAMKVNRVFPLILLTSKLLYMVPVVIG